MVAAGTEVVTEVAVLAAPSLVTQVLFGGELSRIGLATGASRGFRIARTGPGMLAFAGRGVVAVSALRAFLFFSVLTVGYLVYLGVGAVDRGILLWPAAALHAIFALLLGWAWRGERRT
jgi:hypothetical protein